MKKLHQKILGQALVFCAVGIQLASCASTSTKPPLTIYTSAVSTTPRAQDSIQNVVQNLPMVRAIQQAENGQIDSALSIVNNFQFSHPTSKAYQAYLKMEWLNRKQDSTASFDILDSVVKSDSITEWTPYFKQKWASKLVTRPVWSDSDRVFARLESERRLPASIRWRLALRFLREAGFTGKPHPADTLLPSILDLASPSIDSLYHVIVDSNAVGTLRPEIELALLEYERGRRYFEKALERCPPLALKEIPPYITKAMRLIHPQIQYEKGDYEKSAKFIYVYESYYGPHPTLVQLMAKIFKAQKNSVDSAAWEEKYIKLYPRAERTARLYWLSAWEAEDSANFELALEYHQKIVSGFPDLSRANWSLYRMGIIYFKTGDFAKAIEYFSKATATEDPASIVSSGLYWQARCYYRMGDTSRALEMWKQTYTKFPVDFYGIESRKMLVKHQQLPIHPSWATPQTPWTKAGFEEYMQGFAGQTKYQPLQAESPDLPLEILFQFNYRPLAEQSYRYLFKKNGYNPYFLWHYSQMLKPYWETESYKLAHRLSGHIPIEGWARVPRPLMEMMYPHYFSDILFKYAHQNNIEPAMAYAVIKQESGFDPVIGSSAGAIGLMQIIPPTAEMLAKKEAIDNWNVQRLKNPEDNVRLGTRYISDLLKDYNGNFAWVLTNYNAGPTPTARWRAKLDSLDYVDQVEGISYAETRDYVKKVTANYYTYRLLYGE